MKTMTPWLAAMVLLSPIWAQDPAATKPDVGRRLEELQKEQTEIVTAWRAAAAEAAKAAKAAKPGESVPAMAMRPDFKALRGKHLAAANEYQGDDQVKLLLPALMMSDGKEQCSEVIALLLKDHIKSKELAGFGPMFPSLGYMIGDEEAAKVLARFEADAEDPTVLAWVAYARSKPVFDKEPVQSPAFQEAKKKALAAADKAADERLLQMIKSDLTEKEAFGIGMVAPEIAGTDLDGIDFKLSDYQGKVVFVDFWGDW
jgi:hypothetical protein